MCMYLSSAVAPCLWLFYSKCVTVDEATKWDTNCHTCIDFEQNVKLYWCSSIEYSKWHHCTHVNPHLEYFDQVKKQNKVIVWDNYLQLFVYDKAPGVQYSWYNVLLSAGPKFLKEKKGLNHMCRAWTLKSSLRLLIYLPWVSRLNLQTFLAFRIGC